MIIGDLQFQFQEQVHWAIAGDFHVIVSKFNHQYLFFYLSDMPDISDFNQLSYCLNRSHLASFINCCNEHIQSRNMLLALFI